MKSRHLDPQTPGANGNPTIDPPLAIDFNALARPEGAPDLGTDFSTDGLPNLDPPPAQTTTPATTTPASVIIDPSKKPEIVTPDPNDAFPFKAIKSQENRVLIEKLANKYGENFKLPEDVSDENVFEHIEDALRPKVDFHPEVLKINDAVKKGIPFEQIVKGYNQLTDLKSLPAKELVTTSLKNSYGKTEKNPNGWDDAKINDMVAKMESTGLLDIEAEKIKHGIDQRQASYVESLNVKKEQEMKTYNEAATKERDTEITNTLSSFNKLNDVFGIPLTQSEKAEFAEDLRILVTPDETGAAPVLKWLQSNDNLAKVAFLMKKGDSKIKEALTLAKSNVKKEFVNKLDPEPKMTPKANPLMTQEIDLEALSRPAVN